MALQFKSSRFGELEIEDHKVISMPDGILGFSERRFVLLSPKKGPFHWLQSVDNPDLAFVVTDPKTAVGDYPVKLTKTEFEKLGLNQDTEIVVLALVTMNRNPYDITMNLLGPIIINPENMTALQVVLEEKEFSTRHPYFQDTEKANIQNISDLFEEKIHEAMEKLCVR
jgi:flagellar assembly factor FliW